MRCSVGHYTPPRIYLEYLVVAGGGGGGDISSGRLGGGGGAGGVLQASLRMARNESVTVTVGAGGIVSGGNDGGDGSNSILGQLTAIGGGGGGRGGQNGRSGGSGGGGGQTTTGTTNGGAETSGQGTAGQGGGTGYAGDGGSFQTFGLYSLMTGTAAYYAFGGGNWAGPLPPNGGHGGVGGKFAGTGGIVVSGAGTSGANGTYEISGTSFLDSPKYRLGTTTYYIENDGLTWNIVDGATVLYSLNSTPADIEFYNPYIGPLPQGPATAVNGATPVPTISDDLTSLPGQSGSDGVVVIAYEDTFPALTVGAGLTYDQPSRAGYRVYRFTAGSGSITFN